MNLIKNKVDSQVHENHDELELHVTQPETQEALVVPDKKKKNLIKKSVLSFLIFIFLAASGLTFTAYRHKANAATFGLGNDYNQILELNDRLSNNVPVSIETISTSHTNGDKRVVALLIFFQKYNSPMASSSVAKAFIDNADKNGFGDRWALLPAISGIESGFGKIIPRKRDHTPSYNAWGWGGPGNWHYFSSWEDAAAKISTGIARGYGATNLNPERMMASYCPPCAKSGGAWAKHVNMYIAELNSIYKSL
jgi:hypothetical protein